MKHISRDQGHVGHPQAYQYIENGSPRRRGVRERSKELENKLVENNFNENTKKMWSNKLQNEYTKPNSFYTQKPLPARYYNEKDVQFVTLPSV